MTMPESVKVFVHLLFVLIVGRCVVSQICTQYHWTRAISHELHRISYMETYRVHNCWFRKSCVKSRIVYQNTRIPSMVPKYTITQRCCTGYVRNETDTNDDSIKCSPICVPACTNGYCQKPGECACNDGYEVNQTNSHICDPVCEGGCEFGTCIAPNTCQCNYGYSLNGTCQPICTSPCDNGHCIAPETCECMSGYRKSDTNLCEPYCSAGCTNGTCMLPEVCNCDPGYKNTSEGCMPHCDSCGSDACIEPGVCDCDSGILRNGTCQPECISCDHGNCVTPNVCVCDVGYQRQDDICQPICTQLCNNGTCVGPDTCECNPGFNKTYSNNCMPYCSDGCDDGVCVEPEICSCNVGFKKDFLGICSPDCKDNCNGNGRCVAPNTCECLPGYINESIAGISVCKPSCLNCGGSCVEPNECICEAPYEARNERADGEPCACFENCSDVTKKCERTVCLKAASSYESGTTTERTNDTKYMRNKDKYDYNDKNRIDYEYGDPMDNDYSEFTTTHKASTPEVHTSKYNNTIVKKTSDITFKESKGEVKQLHPLWIYTIASMLALLAHRAY